MTMGMGIASAVGGSLLVLLSGCGYKYPAEEEQAIWRNKCAPVIAFARGEYVRLGVFPTNLPAKYQTVLDGLSVPGRFDVFSPKTAFNIEIGDYQRDGWTYIYNSYYTNWYMDH